MTDDAVRDAVARGYEPRRRTGDYWERDQARYEECEPRPCPSCRTVAHMSKLWRRLELRPGRERSILYWHCDRCSRYCDPVAQSPRDLRRWYREQIGEG